MTAPPRDMEGFEVEPVDDTPRPRPTAEALVSRADAMARRVAQDRQTTDAAQLRMKLGVERSYIAAGGTWHDAALEVIASWLDQNPTLYGEQLWPYLPEPPPGPDGKPSRRGLGAAMQAAGGRGWMRRATPTGSFYPIEAFVAMPAVSSNLGGTPLWISNRYAHSTAPPDSHPEQHTADHTACRQREAQLLATLQELADENDSLEQRLHDITPPKFATNKGTNP